MQTIHLSILLPSTSTTPKPPNLSLHQQCLTPQAAGLERCTKAAAEWCEQMGPRDLEDRVLGFNIGALIIRIGFWGPLYYIYNKEPPKTLF